MNAGRPGVDVGLDGHPDAVDAEQRERGGPGKHGGHARSRTRARVLRAFECARCARACDVTMSDSSGGRRSARSARATRHAGALPCLAWQATADRRSAAAASSWRRAHLERHGWRIVERNFRTREGEIDLIAAAQRNARLLRGEDAGRTRPHPPAARPIPWSRSGPRKRSQVRRMARAWMAQGGSRRPVDAGTRRLRLDVIGVLLAARRYALAPRPPRERFLNLSKHKDRAELRRIPRRWRAARLLAPGRLDPPGDGAAVRGSHRGRRRPRGARRRRRASARVRGLALGRRSPGAAAARHHARGRVRRLRLRQGPGGPGGRDVPVRTRLGVEISDDLTQVGAAQPRALAAAPPGGQQSSS